jgi:tetratricopeptide (TPR) repeat protein
LMRFVGIWERLALQNPQVVGFQNDLAMVYDKLGQLHAAIGAPEEAIGFAKKAVSKWHKIAGDYPSEPRYREVLAHGYHELWYALQTAGRLAEAEDANSQALALREELVAASPKMPSYRNDLAESVRIHADRLAQTGKFKEAENAYRRSIKMCQDLIDEYPTAMIYRETLFFAQFPLMKLLESTGQIPDAQALQNHLEAIETIVQLTKDLPTDHNFRNTAIAELYPNFGLFLKDHGRPPDAIVERLQNFIRSDEPKSIQRPFNKLVLAVAQKRLGHSHEAERCLGEGVEWIEKNGGEKLQAGAVRTEPLNAYMRGQLELLRKAAEEAIKNRG